MIFIQKMVAIKKGRYIIKSFIMKRLVVLITQTVSTKKLAKLRKKQDKWLKNIRACV